MVKANDSKSAHPPGALDFGPRDTLPKNDPQYIRRYADAAEQCEYEAAQREKCPCPRCNLALFETRIHGFVCAATVEAAYTGDTSKLEAILGLVNALKAK